VNIIPIKHITNIIWYLINGSGTSWTVCVVVFENIAEVKSFDGHEDAGKQYGSSNEIRPAELYFIATYDPDRNKQIEGSNPSKFIPNQGAKAGR
jgi:hypothetical protein